MLDFIALAQQCAPTVEPQTMVAVARVESTFNPYAIGVVGGRLQRQPRSLEEAVATAYALEAGGWNFSVGLAQVNRYNLPKYKLSYEQAFDPCANLRAGSKILEDCYVRASRKLPGRGEQGALHAAFSCYYSGNFQRGFRPDRRGEPSYVQKIVAAAGGQAKPIPVVPAIAGAKPPRRDKAASDVPQAAARPENPPAPAVSLPPPDQSSVLVDIHGRAAPAASAQEGTSSAAVEPPAEAPELPQEAGAGGADAAPVKVRRAEPEEPVVAAGDGVVVF